MPARTVSPDHGPPPAGEAARRINRLIDRFGSVPVSLFMAEANGHYYATRDPFGVAGDFITAPEISQMFGEMIGLWAADLALRAGEAFAWAELGPGRGTLSADALRAMAKAGLAPSVHLVETSPVLRDLQAAKLPGAQFHADVATLPTDRPLIVIANEFFDALPVRQLVQTPKGWRERAVAREGDAFIPVVAATPMDAMIPSAWRDAAVGTIVETCPAAVAIFAELAHRIAAQGGALLAIDYGYTTSQPGDTLQAMARHAHADVFADPGERDLTAHVDFATLAAGAADSGVRLSGPVGQGAFLERLGLPQRAAALARARPDRAEALAQQQHRLMAPEQMGELFKVLAATAPHWPAPEGF